MTAKHSPLEIKHSVRERRDPLLIMRISVMRSCWWTRRTWTSEFQGHHILLWSNWRVPAFENWFRKLRTIQIDMLFNKIYDKINHVTHLVWNQRKWFRMWATSNCVKCSTRNPKRSAQHAYRIGISWLSIAHGCIYRRKKQRSIANSLNIRRIFFVPEYFIKKGRAHGHIWWKARTQIIWSG